MTQDAPSSMGRNKHCFFQKQGPGAYNSCPGKERAKERGRVAAATPARISNTETQRKPWLLLLGETTCACPPAMQQPPLPVALLSALCQQSQSLARRLRQQECQGSGNCQGKLLFLTFSHPQQISLLPVSKD